MVTAAENKDRQERLEYISQATSQVSDVAARLQRLHNSGLIPAGGKVEQAYDHLAEARQALNEAFQEG